MKKRITAFLLALFVLASLAVPVSAADSRVSGIVVNPLYPRQAGAGQVLPKMAAPSRVAADRLSASYASPEEAARQLCAAMLERRTGIILDIALDRNLTSSAAISEWFENTFFPMAYSMDIAETPFDGDYLKWSWNIYRYDCVRAYGNQYTFNVALEYYTEVWQEEEVALDIAELAGELGMYDAAPYDAYFAAYEWITANISYDHEGEDAFKDNDSANDDYSIFTAWGALHNRKAVCQGFSALYYALCRQAGLDVRIFTSQSHAWNAVKLRNLWYQMDSTWDSGKGSSNWRWFLLGSIHFREWDMFNHQLSQDYTTQEFRESYPLSEADYNTEIPYTDVRKEFNSYYEGIRRATELGLLNGTSEYTFSPEEPVDRAMLITVLWRMEGAPEDAEAAPFTDVEADDYFAQAAAWAYAEGITNGVGGGLFDPEGQVTREQLASFLYRYALYLDLDTPVAEIFPFIDAGEISSYAETPMRWGVATGIVQGTSLISVSPGLIATRQQLALILVRMVDYYQLDNSSDQADEQIEQLPEGEQHAGQFTADAIIPAI